MEKKSAKRKNDFAEFGDLGEELAAAALEDKGYLILARKYRRKTGEVDIIAEDPQKGVLVFVEVKSRRSLKFGRPAESVTKAKVRQIKRTASLYIVECMKPDKLHRYSGIRFDVIEILVTGSSAEASHIEGAF
jgi:putative endonuclease